MLAAFWSLEDRPAHDPCAEMIRAQAPNPPQTALWHRGPIALGIDSALRAGEGRGNAPVTGASKTLVLVADVRLDNRGALLRQLDLAQGDAGELSDTWVMMLAFERWGLAATGRFVGDFAFILWDKAARQLHLARDFAGQRPLFFHRSARALAVASMARGIHALDFIPCRPDRQRMLEMLAGLPHEGSHSFFEGVERVEPGEIVTLERSARSSRSFWSPPHGKIRFRKNGDYAEALIEKLGRAVDARLRDSDGRVGTHLSAGLDSSAVTALASERSDGRVLAFTSVPSGKLPVLPEGRFGDEGALASQTARLYPNIEHQLVETGERIPLEDLEWQLALFERPDLNLPNLTWSNRINDAAMASGVTVMLTGAGGNATISYGDSALLHEFLRKGLIGSFVRECIAARRAGMLVSAPAALVAKNILPARLVQRLRHPRGKPREHIAALNRAAPGATQVLERLSAMSMTIDTDSTAMRWHMLRRVDPGSYNKGVLARWNVDLRDPTADRELVEFCMQIPIDQFFRGGVSRALARRALEGLVPDAVRLEPSRGLQSANWFAMLTNARDEAGQMLDELSLLNEVRELVDLDEPRRLHREWPLASATFGPLEYRTGLLRGLSAAAFVRSCAVRKHAPDSQERTADH
jgi:asparagine synthase (glutamine-hydrolysing)